MREYLTAAGNKRGDKEVNDKRRILKRTKREKQTLKETGPRIVNTGIGPGEYPDIPSGVDSDAATS
jgi:hypothetical protein